MVDLLQSHPEAISIEVTSKCNLRCAYCHKADPILEAQPGANEDMTDKMIADLYRYCKEVGIKLISLSLGGETTITAGWHRRITQFLSDPEIELHMVSNFARLFDDEELVALTKYRYLQISFDSAEFEMVRKMRSRADLRTITYNITRLRQKGRELGRQPFIMVNCTVCRENIGHIGKLAGFCRELAVDQLLLTPMMQVTTHDAPNLPEPLLGLSNDEVVLLCRNVLAAEQALQGSTTSLCLRDRLRAQLASVIESIRDGTIPADAAADFHRPFEGSACRQPWNTPIVGAAGTVWACCGSYNHRESVGQLGRQTLVEIHNGNAIRAIRASILDGRPIVDCEKCSFASSASFQEFAREIRQWQGDTGVTH
jgi:sulfatase maturation enzyme AslB (radical SAM superfamily)